MDKEKLPFMDLEPVRVKREVNPSARAWRADTNLISKLYLFDTSLKSVFRLLLQYCTLYISIKEV